MEEISLKDKIKFAIVKCIDYDNKHPRKEFIEFYEEELQKLEKHKEGLLEVDKNTTYTDKKICQIEDLLSVLRNCDKSEILKMENIECRKIMYKIEKALEEAEKAKRRNDNREVKLIVYKLLEYLKEKIEEEN